MLTGFKEVCGTVLKKAASETGFLGSILASFPRPQKHPPNKSKDVMNWKKTLPHS